MTKHIYSACAARFPAVEGRTKLWVGQFVRESAEYAMIEAFLHGKLSREQENLEDMLTSCVFGSLRLIPPSKGLLPFLLLAEPFAGEEPVLSPAVISSITKNDLEYEFWPMLQAEGCHRCEPDLLLTIQPVKQLVLIEAKLFSGKSTEPDDGLLPFDQLAREWDNVVRLAEARELEPHLLYLTADPQMPRDDIEESVAELELKRSHALPPRIHWLSWQHLLRVEVDDQEVLQRLSQLLERLDLMPFSGWPPLQVVPHYEFANAPLVFHWGSCPTPLRTDWNFGKSNE